MSDWTCNDGMSDDEVSPHTIVLNSPSPPSSPPNPWMKVQVQSNTDPDPVTSPCSLSPTPTGCDQFYTDGCGDRPYAKESSGNADSQSISRDIQTENALEHNYPERNYLQYMGPRIPVDYTSKIQSTKEYSSNRDYISSKDVFAHVSLGGRLPRNIMSNLDSIISDKVFNSFIGNDKELKEFTNFYWKPDGTSSAYTNNCVASPYRGYMFLTRNYDIILSECTKAFLKYNDQVIY